MQTIAGGIKAKATIHKKYGSEYYRETGRVGGAAKVPKGFSMMSPEKRAEAGRKGGTTRALHIKGKKIPPHICVEKGKLKWYYNVVSHNGKILGTSQKYWSKTNAVRAAKTTAAALGGTIIIREK